MIDEIHEYEYCDTQGLLEEYASLLDTVRYTERTLLNILMSFFENLPLPSWIKATRPNGDILLIRVNQKYVNTFGKHNIKHQHDSIEIWGKEPSIQAYNNDLKVIDAKTAIDFKEIIRNPNTGKEEVWNVTKYPIFNEIGEIIAVCGLAIYSETYLDEHGY